MHDSALKDTCTTLSIVIPIYNEKENIRESYDEVSAILENLGHDYEVIYVDDGSTDGSFGLLSDLCKTSGHVKAIRLRRNSGQSAAMSAGFDYASGDYIITMDGDLQNDPADIPKLIEKLSDDYDVVCGWRVNRKDGIGKKISSRISNALRVMLIGDNIHDYGCTLRAYKKECIKDFELFGDMHRYIPAMMRFNGYRVGEIAVNHRERRHGKSKYNWKRLFKGFSDLLVVTFWNRFATRPMHIFGTAGIFICGIGGLVTLYFLIQRLLFDVPLSDKPMFTLSILSVIIGVQFIAFGILADISLKTYYSQRKFKNYRVEKKLGFN